MFWYFIFGDKQNDVSLIVIYLILLFYPPKEKHVLGQNLCSYSGLINHMFCDHQPLGN